MSYVAEVKANVREDGDVVISVFQNDVWVAGGRTGHNVHKSLVPSEDFWAGIYEHAQQVVASKGLHFGRFSLEGESPQAASA